jgi:hypothetical protein
MAGVTAWRPVRSPGHGAAGSSEWPRRPSSRPVRSTPARARGCAGPVARLVAAPRATRSRPLRRRAVGEWPGSRRDAPEDARRPRRARWKPSQPVGGPVPRGSPSGRIGLTADRTARRACAASGPRSEAVPRVGTGNRDSPNISVGRTLPGEQVPMAQRLGGDRVERRMRLFGRTRRSTDLPDDAFDVTPVSARSAAECSAARRIASCQAASA